MAFAPEVTYLLVITKSTWNEINNRMFLLGHYEGVNMKKKVIILSLVALAAAACIVVPPIVAANEAGPGAQNRGTSVLEDPVFSVRIESAGVQTLQAYLETNGNIITEQQVSVVPDASGKIVSMKVGLGSTVRKGQLIAEVDPSRPGTTYSLSPVYAPIAGIVTTTPMAIGSTVSTASAITTISVMKDLEIEVLIPEREVGQLKEGLKAGVTLQAFPGELFSATVVNVSPVVDPNSRTKKIVLKFDHDDTRVNAGMFARVKLNTRTYSDVVTIPAEAVVQTRGSTYVYVLEGIDQVSMKKVDLGVTVDDLTEVKSGLSAGDSVVIQGQQFLTDGALVKVVNARSQA